MKKAFWLGVVLAAIGAFPNVGCFFEKPIDGVPQVHPDAAILGSWRCLPFDAGPESNPGTFIVAARPDDHYRITFLQGDDKPEEYDAHASIVKGRPILNVRVLDPKFPLKPWTFARYTLLRPHVAEVELVDETKLEGLPPTSVALRQALEKEGNDDLWGPYCACVRVSAKSK